MISFNKMVKWNRQTRWTKCN